MPRRNWTHEELIIAFNLYCKIPFGRIHNRNPIIIELAKRIGRTPSALSWKLANFARLDPALRKRNIAGARHGALADIEIWDEFNSDWDKLAFESERLMRKMTGIAIDPLEEVDNFPVGMSRAAIVRIRVNQGFFRAAVLAAHNDRCCITGLSIPSLLTASHIVPWSMDTKNRTNPRNGLCLNALHDKAFDSGLLTVTPDLKVKLSPRTKSKSADIAAREFLQRFDGAPILQPRRFAPDAVFLHYHNEKIFLNS